MTTRIRHRCLAATTVVALVLSAGVAMGQPYQLRPGEAVLSYGGGFVTSGSNPNSFCVIGQQTAGRMTGVDYSIEVGLVPVCGLAPLPLTTNAFWNAAAGPWNTAGNWLPAQVPTNADPNRYEVYINNVNGDDLVTLDINPSIDRLFISDGAVLQVNQASAAPTRAILFTPSPITNATNAGTIRVSVTTGSNRQLDLTDLKINQSGAGLMEALSTSASPTAVLRLTDSRVVGGVVRANGPGSIVKIRNSSIFESSTFEATNEGVLDIDTNVSGNAQYYSTSGSSILLRPGNGNALSGGSVTASSGTGSLLTGAFDIDGNGGSDYTATFSGSASFSGPAGGGGGFGSSQPVLVIGSRGNLSVAHDINFDGAAVVDLASGSEIRLSGHWHNLAVRGGPNSFNSDAGVVRMVAVTPGPPTTQNFELAGQDRGFNFNTGFPDNFSLNRLEVGPGRIVHFQDTFSNSPPAGSCNEVLYVQEFMFGAGCQITVDCGRVYYASSLVNGTGYTVNLINGGTMAYVGLAGDIDGNGLVNAADVPSFVAALISGLAANPDRFFRSDLNHNGAVDGRDIQSFVDALP